MKTRSLPGARETAAAAAGSDAASDWEANQKSIPRLPIPGGAGGTRARDSWEYTQQALLTKHEQQLTRRVLLLQVSERASE